MKQLISIIFITYFFLYNSTIYNTNNRVSKVIYKKSTYESRDLNRIKNLKIREQIKKGIEIEKKLEYLLLFDTNKSSYQLIRNLEIKDDSPLVLMAKGFKQIFYRNIKTKEKVDYNEATGKGFNVLLPYNQYKWIITKETKTIGNYLCFKAMTYFQEINPLTKGVREFTPVVWFTPDIPVPFGPIGLDGLPGLVLEATINGQTYYYATLIEINKYSSNEYSINKPKGKEVTEREYNKILAKAFERN